MTAQPCAYCAAPATHTLWPDREQGRMLARVGDFPRARLEYCARCADALAAGETGEALARRLNTAHAAAGRLPQ